jgi:hypothetical protein
MGIIKERRQQQFREQEAEKEENLKKKLDIIEKIKAMVTSPEEASKTYQEFKALQQEWREIKLVPAERANELWRNYQLYVEQFYDLLKLNSEARELDFKKNLEALRQLATVETICMHGSPRSPYYSKDIWKQYDYKTLSISGEPYLTTDFSKILYLTDTGRRWDGYKVSVRDKIEDFQEEWNAKGWSFHSTDDIIRALQENRLPDQLMITTHPQRWFDFGLNWMKELVLQNTKNIIKGMIVLRKKNG